MDGGVHGMKESKLSGKRQLKSENVHHPCISFATAISKSQ